MSDNMKNWKRFEEVPSWALKRIPKGRLAGKSDISPIWRMQAMTEVFGPCGIGWRYTIDKIWTEPGTKDQIMVFVQASLQIKVNDIWSGPIPGIGGSDLIANESRGPYGNNEAIKCALTDALSVSMKALGVGAKVYMGLWDGSKYIDPAPQNTGKGTPPPPPPEPEPEPEVPKSEAFSLLDTALKGCKTYQDVCQHMAEAKKKLSESEYSSLKEHAMDILQVIDQANLSEWQQYLNDLDTTVAPDECDKLRPSLLKLSPKVQAKLAKEYTKKFPGLFGETK